MIPVLKAVHAALHEHRPFHLAAIHQGQRFFGGEVGLATVPVLGKKVEFLPVAPGSFAAADGTQLTTAAIPCNDLCHMQVCVYFFIWVPSPFWKNEMAFVLGKPDIPLL